jgi:hypothetical protein
MTKTRVINVHTQLACDVFIGRPSKWGNPFLMADVKDDVERLRVITEYDTYLRSNEELLAALPELIGKSLGCYCAPKPCHGDVLAQLIKERFGYTESEGKE